MADAITVTGIVGTEPTEANVSNTKICNFRLASGLRRFDKQSGTWTDYGTNWYSVASYRYLADNTLKSLHKGDHVIVTGRLRVRDWANGDKKGTAVDIDADAIGHDLGWGTTRYERHNKDAGAEDNADTADAEDLPDRASTGETFGEHMPEASSSREPVTVGAPEWHTASLGDRE